MTRLQVPRWALVSSLAGVLIALALSLATDARAQSFDKLDAHNAPDLMQGAGGGTGGLVGWLQDNKTTLLVLFGIFGAVLVLAWILRQNVKTKRLQRDALEKLRKSLLESCKATIGPAKRVWITGSPRDPPARLGRYAGHHRSVDNVWIAYRTWLFGSRRLLCANAADANNLDVEEINVRAIGVNMTRSFGYAVPDVHNSDQRLDWQNSTRLRLSTPDAFAEAWKAYYAHAVDNAIAFYDAMNAAEDRSFLRQEVTRSPDELTETLIAPATPTPKPEEAQTDA
jgi:hypothetical protein